MFPYVDFQHCINQAIDLYQNDLFIYGTTNGLPSLLPIISKRLTDYQVFASPEQIVMTSGIQLALSILSTIPFPNGKQTILVEQPGYHLFLQYLEKNRVCLSGGFSGRKKDSIFRNWSVSSGRRIFAFSIRCQDFKTRLERVCRNKKK